MATKKRKRQARGRSSKTHPFNLKARLKAAQALELRCEGMTFIEIAKELGYNSKQAAHDAVTRAMTEVIQEPAEKLRVMELIRLDKMMQVPYLNAQSGDNFAIDSVLKIMDRRARYLGINAPTKAEVTGKDGEPLVAAAPVLNIFMEPDDDERSKPEAAQEAVKGISKPSH